jgi:hypothetical protein
MHHSRAALVIDNLAQPFAGIDNPRTRAGLTDRAGPRRASDFGQFPAAPPSGSRLAMSEAGARPPPGEGRRKAVMPADMRR